jgi:hypothetical protein
MSNCQTVKCQLTKWLLSCSSALPSARQKSVFSYPKQRATVLVGSGLKWRARPQCLRRRRDFVLQMNNTFEVGVMKTLVGVVMGNSVKVVWLSYGRTHIGPCHVSGIFLPSRVNSLPLATIYEVKIPLRKWKISLLQRNPAQMTWPIITLIIIISSIIISAYKYIHTSLRFTWDDI